MATWSVDKVTLAGAVAAVPGGAIDVRSLGGAFTEVELDRAQRAVGLKELHRVQGRTTGDLNLAAARRLLSLLRWEAQSVDVLISVTQTPDQFLPGNAYVAHRALGCRPDTMTFDMALGCSGFTYAVSVASKLVGPDLRRVLILAGDTISRIVDPDDKGTCLLFGDAGSAVALSWEADGGRLSLDMGADGSGVTALHAEGGGFRGPVGDMDRPRVATLKMDGIGVFAFTNRVVHKSIRDVCVAHGWELADVHAFLLHQANGMVSAAVAKKLGLPVERFPSNIAQFGNTSVASIPLLLADGAAFPEAGTGPVPVVMSGFGVGFSWASVAGTLPANFVRELIVLPAEAAA